MKRILNLAIINLLLLTASLAQVASADKHRNSFIEWNLGIAHTYQETFFPGTSVLFGQTFVSATNFIFEYEAGLALPSIVTGKIGVGKKFRTSSLTAGVRPFPFNFYIQTHLRERSRGYWIISAEVNPFYSNAFNKELLIHYHSSAIFTFGYRWTLGRKK